MVVCGKFREKLKRVLKSWTRCNWPELTNYCGCCKVSTGIYIRCVLTVIVTSCVVTINGMLVTYLWDVKNTIKHANVTVVKDFLEETDQDFGGLLMVINGAIIYLIFWNSFKVTYIIRNLWIIYALYTSSRRTLRTLLYIGVSCWVFDVCLSIIATILLSQATKGLFFVNLMFEGYNLIALNSKYKELAGKSRIVKEIHLEEPPLEIINPDGTPVSPDTNVPHCTSCKCYSVVNSNDTDENHNRDTAGVPSTSVPITPVAEACASNDNVTKDDDRKLNFKDSPIIYNQDILNEDGNYLLASPTNSATVSMVRPTTLALNPLETKKEKADLCDVPCIYDDGQLNIGISPIIEKRDKDL